MSACEVKIRAYDIKSCAYEVKISVYEVNIPAYEVKSLAQKSTHGSLHREVKFWAHRAEGYDPTHGREINVYVSERRAEFPSSLGNKYRSYYHLTGVVFGTRWII